MAVVTRSQSLADAQTIRDEVAAGANTATRVGGWMVDVADSTQFSADSAALIKVRALADVNVASLNGLANVVDTVAIDTDGDGVTLTAQSTGSQNGPWIAHAGAWTRPLNYQPGGSAAGTLVQVTEGATYADQTWTCTTDPPNDVIDTDPTAWSRAVLMGDVTGALGATNVAAIQGVEWENASLGTGNVADNVIARHRTAGGSRWAATAFTLAAMLAVAPGSNATGGTNLDLTGGDAIDALGELDFRRQTEPVIRTTGSGLVLNGYTGQDRTIIQDIASAEIARFETGIATIASGNHLRVSQAGGTFSDEGDIRGTVSFQISAFIVGESGHFNVINYNAGAIIIGEQSIGGNLELRSSTGLVYNQDGTPRMNIGSALANFMGSEIRTTGFVTTGAIPAISGAFRGANNAALKFRNFLDDGDLRAVFVSVSDILTYGQNNVAILGMDFLLPTGSAFKFSIAGVTQLALPSGFADFGGAMRFLGQGGSGLITAVAQTGSAKNFTFAAPPAPTGAFVGGTFLTEAGGCGDSSGTGGNWQATLGDINGGTYGAFLFKDESTGINVLKIDPSIASETVFTYTPVDVLLVRHKAVGNPVDAKGVAMSFDGGAALGGTNNDGGDVGMRGGAPIGSGLTGIAFILGGNVSLQSQEATAFGGMVGGIVIDEATTNPSSAPSSSPEQIFLYVDGADGLLKYRDSSDVTHTLT